MLEAQKIELGNGYFLEVYKDRTFRLCRTQHYERESVTVNILDGRVTSTGREAQDLFDYLKKTT